MLDEVDRDGSGEVEFPGEARSSEVAGLIAARCRGADPSPFCLLSNAGAPIPLCAEFLEIMTVQLNRMAEERDSGGSGGGNAAPREGEAEGGEAAGAAGAGGVAAAGTPDAAALPFDIVATAYRRKKLLEALDQDNK